MATEQPVITRATFDEVILPIYACLLYTSFCLDFFSITAYLNDSASTLLDTNQDRPRLPLNGLSLIDI